MLDKFPEAATFPRHALNDDKVDFRQLVEDAIVKRGLEPMEEIAATRTAKNDVRDPIFSRKGDQSTGHIVMFREMTKPPIFCAVSKVSAI